MKERLWTIWTYFAIGLFVLGMVIIYGVTRSSNFNVYFLVVGIVLLVPGIVSMAIETMDFGSRTDSKMLSDLKLSGMQVRVDLTKCRIIGNSWTITKPVKKSTTILLNALSNNSDENNLTVDAVLSRVKYSCFVNGKKRTFISPTISRDKLTLELLLEAQKETSIYIDRDDPRYYYFDLEFTKDKRT